MEGLEQLNTTRGSTNSNNGSSNNVLKTTEVVQSLGTVESKEQKEGRSGTIFEPIKGRRINDLLYSQREKKMEAVPVDVTVKSPQSTSLSSDLALRAVVAKKVRAGEPIPSDIKTAWEKSREDVKKRPKEVIKETKDNNNTHETIKHIGSEEQVQPPKLSGDENRFIATPLETEALPNNPPRIGTWHDLVYEKDGLRERVRRIEDTKKS